MQEILVPTSPGELIDKITILDLKLARVSDEAKLGNIRHEHAVLTALANRLLPQTSIGGLRAELARINAELWQIEDDIRACEERQDFGPDFVALARAVYLTNDRRAAVKRQINQSLGSEIIEEKSYFGSNSAV